MWKKFREASSGVTLSSVKNIFRSWTYDKFEGDDEASAQKIQVRTEELDTERDKENNVVLWSKTERVSQLRSTDRASDSEETDDDFGFDSLNTPNHTERFSVKRQQVTYDQASEQVLKEYSQEQVCDLSDSYSEKHQTTLDEDICYDNYDDKPKRSEKDTSSLVRRRDHDAPPLEHNSSTKEKINSFVSNSGRKLSRGLSRRSDSGHLLNPKTEVKEIVNSFSQRRYQQLDDSDESFHSCHDDFTQPVGEIVGIDESNVFHKADEVHTDLKPKSSKLKGSRKVSNLFRRIPCMPDSNTNTSLR